jgi:excisionase family DNA binding protein
MKLAFDRAELRAAALALLADAEVRDAVRGVIPSPGTEATHVTIAAFSRRWGVSRRTVCNWLLAGLPTVRLGRLVRIPLADADAWIVASAAARGGKR